MRYLKTHLASALPVIVGDANNAALVSDGGRPHQNTKPNEESGCLCASWATMETRGYDE